MRGSPPVSDATWVAQDDETPLRMLRQQGKRGSINGTQASSDFLTSLSLHEQFGHVINSETHLYLHRHSFKLQLNEIGENG